MVKVWVANFNAKGKVKGEFMDEYTDKWEAVDFLEEARGDGGIDINSGELNSLGIFDDCYIIEFEGEDY